MPSAYFTWRGKNSLIDYNMEILADVDFTIPETSYDFQDIPGLNHDLAVSRKKLQGFIKTIPVIVRHRKDGTTFPEQIRNMIAWLKGYVQTTDYPNQLWEDLFFSGYPDIFYKAIFHEAITETDTMNNRESVVINLKFRCQPFAYLYSGMEPINVENNPGEVTSLELDLDIDKRFDTPFAPLITAQISDEPTSTTAAILWYRKNSSYRLKGILWNITEPINPNIITFDFELGVAYDSSGANYGYVFLDNNTYVDMTLSGANRLDFRNLKNVQVIPRYRVVAM